MSLLEQIQKDQLAARKARAEISINLLTTLYSEAVNVGKNQGNRASTDEEVIAVVKKFVKANNENVTIYEKANKVEALALARAERVLLDVYLPKAPTTDELNAAITNIIVDKGLVKEPASMGKIMKELKEMYGSALDGAVASKLIKENL